MCFLEVRIILGRRAVNGISGNVPGHGRRKTRGNFPVLMPTKFDPGSIPLGLVLDRDLLLAA